MSPDASEQISTESDVAQQLLERIPKLNPTQQSELLHFINERFGASSRQHLRKGVFTAVDYCVKDRYFQDFVKDISAGGLFLETRENLPVGEEAYLTFMLSGHAKPFKIRGKIVRSAQGGYGVKFEDLSREQMAVLKYLSEKS